MADKDGYVYIMANKTLGVLYVGVTSDLLNRVAQHRSWELWWFTTRYHCKKLVYYECVWDMYGSISREKQIKAGNRASKIILVESMNPNWDDLFETFD